MPLSKITGNSFNASANTNIDNGLLFLNATQNRVGIGTTSPTTRFHAYTNEAENNTIAVFQNDISTPGYLGEVILSAPNRPAVRTNYRTSNDTNGFFNYDTGEFKFFANAGGSPSEAMRVNRFGIGLGGNSPSSGLGITFPATQVASSDANTLDDYEEGTYTATMTTTVSGTITLNSGINALRYTKIGNTVTIQGRIAIQSISSPVGAVRISVPFVGVTGGPGQADYMGFNVYTHDVDLTAGAVSLFAEMNGGTVATIFQVQDNAAWTALNGTTLKGNGNEYFYMFGTYMTTT
jgi:hypothetical protein